MLRNFIIKYDRQVHRALEILPGAFSWSAILLLLVGGFLIPTKVAYLVILFYVFWFYKSVTIAFFSVLTYYRIKASKTVDWVTELKGFPDWQKVHHVIIIVTYKEPLHVLERTVRSLADQELPLKQMTIVLAMEAREDEQQREEKKKALQKEFGNKFGNLFFTVHQLAPGEAIGKSSNENYAARWVKKELVDRQKMNIDYLTITSCDADHVYHPKHFSCLAFKFLDNPKRYNRFWQPAVFFYTNFWRLPAPNRVVNTFGSIWNGALLGRSDRLINCQNYSASLKMIDEIGYWDPEIIPEDYHIFFKAFYKLKGKLEVEPIYLPLYADAAEGKGTWSTIVSQYRQFQRWAWGVSDDPYVIKNFFLTPGISFWNKTIRVLRLVEDHFLWPVNWFFITIGMSLPSVLHPTFSRTMIGYNLPRLATIILTTCLIFLVVILIVDMKQRPPRPVDVPRWKAFLIPLEFILMPIAGFIFNALPGLDAHTRLMLGKYLEYRVTEKV
ncbi:MAG: glycosyltransferase family 2 protein [bacterium]|nr:glycosyltransferase family 2 protein [bacterium]